MPEWMWLRGVWSWIPFPSRKDRRDDFDVVTDKSLELIQTLQEDLRGLREVVREQDVHNRELREEVQRLHQQHINCEKTQVELRTELEQTRKRVHELEQEVQELRSQVVGDGV